MPNKHLVLLQVDEDCEPKIEEIDPGGPEVTEAVEEDQHHLSFHALKSVPRKGIMNFWGMIHGQRVQILVDGGSSLATLCGTIRKVSSPTKSQLQVMVGSGELEIL